MPRQDTAKAAPPTRWLNATVLGIGLASLLSDWSHEAATAIFPAFLASMGVAAAWVGLIEGVADGLSSLAKLASGHWTDRLARRKPVMVAGYAVTTLATASFGLAHQAWHVLLARSAAWLGRGVRTPVRKAMLAAAVTRETYGRAFGFERMMDTLGAIIGPMSAFLLLKIFGGNFSRVFIWSLLPGVGAVAAVMFLVNEGERKKISGISFADGLRGLPAQYKRFVIAVGLFGAGDAAHTMLILLATQKLAPAYGNAEAAGVAVGLYVLHNVLYAAFAFVAGWLADRMSKAHLLGVGYGLAALTALAIVALPVNVWTLAMVFAFAGIHVGINETVEDSFCAELIEEPRHGVAFGVLATVNGVGDFVSSVAVGAIWSAVGYQAAYGYSLALFLIGACLVWRLNSKA